MNHGLIPIDQWTREDHQTVESFRSSLDHPDLAYSYEYKEMVAADDNRDVFLWKAEEKLFGKTLPAYQQSLGTCVSQSVARACQDQFLIDIAIRNEDSLPDHLRLPLIIATEPIYVGSRQEIGKGRIRGQGSIDSWAIEWVLKYGVLFRLLYEINGKTYDLRKADDQITVAWERTSEDVPHDLEEESRNHPIQDASKCSNGDVAWAAIGNLNGVTIPSSQGFTTTRVGGMCKPSGVWQHDMYLRGRCTRKGNKRTGIIQQSWGQKNPGGDPTLELETGELITLPAGCFGVDWEVIDRNMIRQGGDSNVVSGVKGFRRSGPIDYNDLV